MWILKGALLGLVIFFFATVFYVGWYLRPLRSNKATSLHLLTYLTVNNVWWWVALVVIVGLTCWWFRK